MFAVIPRCSAATPNFAPRGRHLARQVLEVLGGGDAPHLAVGFAIGVQALHDELRHLRRGHEPASLTLVTAAPSPPRAGGRHVPRGRDRPPGTDHPDGVTGVGRGRFPHPGDIGDIGDTDLFPEHLLALLGQLAGRVGFGRLGLLGRLGIKGNKWG